MTNIPCDLLLTNADYLAPDMTIHRSCTIAVRDGRIASISGSAAAPVTADEPVSTAGATVSTADGPVSTTGTAVSSTQFQADEVIDGRGLLWLPGLVDSHIHTSQQLLRGRLLDEKPVIWKRVNVPFESRLTEQTARLSAELASWEMLSFGTTGFVDAGGKHPEIYAEVYDRAGLRGRLSVMTNDNPAAPESLRAPSVRDGVLRLRRMRASLDASCPTRIGSCYSVTTPTAVSEALYRAVLEAAAADDVPFETHLNEYPSEVTAFIERTGLRPFEWLDREHLLPPRMLAAHSIFLSEAEIDVIAENGIRVTHCPFSNCGKGVPPTSALLRRGVPCGFGSDGAGHGGLDLFREMRLFRGVQNVTRGISTADSSIMPAETLLKMATQGGASALFGPYRGLIAEGGPADLIALRIDAPHLWPTQNLLHTIVESASGADVAHSIIDGRLVMKNREVLTLDTERIRFDAKRLIAENPWLTNWT